MPLESVKKGNQTCWRWGKQGKVYCGPSGKKKAIRQGYAEGPDKFKEEMSKGGIEFPAELEESIANDIITNGAEEEQFDHSYLDAVQAYVSQKSRDKMSTEDFGWPEEKKYPIRNQRDLDAASKLIGRAPADKQASIKARIKRIAKRKGLTLPASWGGDK